MKTGLFFLTSTRGLFCLLLITGVTSKGALSPSGKKTSSPSILKLMQAVLKQYENKPTVTMNFEKKSFLKLLKKKYTSSGRVFLSSHQMVVLMDGENTKVVIDKKKNILWYVKNPSSQVHRQSFKTGNGDLNILPLVFSPQAFLKTFRLVSTRSKGRSAIWEFAPKNPGTSRIKTLFLKMENKLILKVRIQWKELGNEEEYEFSDIRFNQKVDSKYFQIPVSKS